MTYRLGALALLVSLSFLSGAQRTPQSLEWIEAEKKAEHAVVQVFAHYAHFDWLEPYKAPKQEQGSGTAFFIDSEGHLLTNFHVVEGAKSIKIAIPSFGQRALKAFVVSVCPEADIALLKVTDEDLSFIKSTLRRVPFLKMGDADLLYPTEPVLALGFPLGQRFLKRAPGVIAGLREPLGDNFCMHITAPINPGNSGGPLLNLEGLVVGINSAGIPGAQNIGFTIPINDVGILMDDLKSSPLVRKPQLGIYDNYTTDEHARALGNPIPAGVYINTVFKGSVADQAGIKAGDMLYAINGYPVDAYGDVTVQWRHSFKVSLAEYCSRLRSKTPLQFEVYRQGQKKILKGVFVATNPAPLRYIYPDYEPHEVDYELVGGACFMQLRSNHIHLFKEDPFLQKYKDCSKSSKEALIVTKLLPGALLQRHDCLYEGALLDEVNGKKVKNLIQLRDALQISFSTGVISLKMKNNACTVVSLKEVIADEKRIAKDFKVKTTPGMKQLIDACAKKQD